MGLGASKTERAPDAAIVMVHEDGTAGFVVRHTPHETSLAPIELARDACQPLFEFCVWQNGRVVVKHTTLPRAVSYADPHAAVFAAIAQETARLGGWCLKFQATGLSLLLNRRHISKHGFVSGHETWLTTSGHVFVMGPAPPEYET
jgi:hypothetical protein